MFEKILDSMGSGWKTYLSGFLMMLSGVLVIGQTVLAAAEEGGTLDFEQIGVGIGMITGGFGMIGLRHAKK